MSGKAKKHQKAAKGGHTRGTLFRDVGKRHLKSARVLLDNHCELDALYLGGYAIECILKYAITRRGGLDHLPANFEIHTLDILLAASGLEKDLERQSNLQAAYATLVEYWEPALRYKAPTLAKGEAVRLYNYIDQLYQWMAERTA